MDRQGVRKQTELAGIFASSFLLVFFSFACFVAAVDVAVLFCFFADAAVVVCCCCLLLLFAVDV